jgi:hypothetical protein
MENLFDFADRFRLVFIYMVISDSSRLPNGILLPFKELRWVSREVDPIFRQFGARAFSGPGFSFIELRKDIDRGFAGDVSAL